jgi:hypothetical protein
MVNVWVGMLFSGVPMVVEKLSDGGVEESRELPLTVTATVSTTLILGWLR